MLEQDKVRAAAERLQRAAQTHVQTRQISLDYPEMTIDDAYAVHKAWVDQMVASGRHIIGHKIGLTSRAMQLITGIDEPDYGVLLDDMLYHDGDRIPVSRFMAPRVEVELAFVLAEDISGPNLTVADVLDATRYIVPAFEILDARVHILDPETKGTRKIVDTISDNAANAALVLGSSPLDPWGHDLSWISALCYRNSQIEETGVAAGVLGNPANGIVWLARKLSPYGIGLKKGQIILSGSFIRPVPGVAGDTFRADFGGAGGVTFQFV